MTVIEYSKEGINVTLTVRQASVRDRLQRNAIFNALPDPADDEGLEAYYYRSHVYANCMACTDIAGDITELTPDEFLDLPDELVKRWADAAFEENPHWFPFFSRREDVESDTTDSTTS